MASKTIAVSILADTKELSKGLGNAEGDLKHFGDTAASESRSAQEHLEGVGEGADTVASKGAQAAGALSGLGDLIGGKFGAAMQVSGVAMQAAADAGDLLNAAIEGGGKIAKKAVAGIKALGNASTYTAAAQKVAAVTSKAWAVAQRVLNNAMRANPIGILVTALVLLVGGLILAYKKSETFRKIVNGAFTKIKQVTQKVLPVVWKIVKTVFKGIWKVIKTYAKIYWTIIKTAWKIVSTVTKAAWKVIQKVIINPMKAIYKFVKSTVGRVKSAMSSAWNAAKSATSKVWNGIKNTVRDKFNDVVGFIRSVPGRIRGVAGRFLDAGRSLIHSLFNGVLSAARSAGGFIGSLVTSIKNAINSALNLPLRVSFNKGPIHINATLIPALANGGITTGPTLAMVGDNPGGREAIIPLDKYPLGSTNVYKITVNAPVGSNPAEIGKTITKYVEAYEKQGGRKKAS